LTFYGFLKDVGLPGVNFINILHARFLYKSELSSFSLITFGFVIFGAKILHEKPSRKTLMKLTAALANFERISIRILPGITIMLKRKVQRIPR